MSDTSEFWAGGFGDEYTKRNRVNWRARILFWDRIVQMTGIRSAFEVGCNAGWNLSAIKHTIHGYHVNVVGCDMNLFAVNQAMACGLQVYQGDIRNRYGPLFKQENDFELVFTAGVLIHVAPDVLQDTMNAIIVASCDYVLAIEYESEREEEVIYRGHSGKLWKRNYGDLYQKIGLDLIETGLLGKDDGFDECTYWLMRKTYENK